jgi:hypothetical protein
MKNKKNTLPARLARLARMLLPLTALAALSACVAPTASRPVVAYPVSYQVPIGNAQVTANDGPQNLNVSASQDVSVEPGKTLYYQVVSPVDVTVSVSRKPGATETTTRLAQMQGTTFTSSIVPDTSALRFTFTAAQANSSGTLKFTLSDRPIASAESSTTTSAY